MWDSYWVQTPTGAALLTMRRHVDLVRVTAAACPPAN
jgi:hypothetical protein